MAVKLNAQTGGLSAKVRAFIGPTLMRTSASKGCLQGDAQVRRRPRCAAGFNAARLTDSGGTRRRPRGKRADSEPFKRPPRVSRIPLGCATKAQRASGCKFHPSKCRYNSVAIRAVMRVTVLAEASETEGARQVHRANLWAVTRVNPEQASKVRDVDADSALTGGRPPRGGEAPTYAAAMVRRGRGSGTQGRFSDATWEARVRRAVATLGTASRWWSARVSERLRVLMKRRNGRGGKEPHFWVLPKEPRMRRLA